MEIIMMMSASVTGEFQSAIVAAWGIGLAALVVLAGCNRASQGVAAEPASAEPTPIETRPTSEPRSSKPAPEPPEIAWETAIQVAFERARRERRVLLVFVHAGWNVASREMARDVWHDLRVRRAVRSVVPRNVDVTEATGEDQERVTRLGVATLPAVLLLDDAGKPIGSIAGPTDAQAVLALLGRAWER